FLAVPAFIGQLLLNANSENLVSIGQNMISWFALPGSTAETANRINWIYTSVYFGLVVLFTYFYTSIMFDSKEIAENLQKQGGFIAGIRPGAQTESYLNKVVTRLTLFGSISLGLLAISPFLIDAVVIGLSLSATPI